MTILTTFCTEMEQRKSKIIDHHLQRLSIAKEMGDRAGQGRAYSNLGNAYYSLSDFQRAIEYHEKDLTIAKDVSDRAGEEGAYAISAMLITLSATSNEP